jgi:hypothetical protein
MKLSTSSENDAKDSMTVHKLDSTQTKLFRPEVYQNHERLGLGQFGFIQRIDGLDLVVDSCNSGNDFLSVFVYFLKDNQGVIIHERVVLVAQLVDFP